MQTMIRPICALLLLPAIQARTVDSEEVLSKSIRYHDPEGGGWGNYRGSFVVLMETPGDVPRRSEITMDKPADRFRLHVKKEGTTKTYQRNAGECSLSFDGKAEFSQEVAEQHGLSCERAEMYRNSYTQA